MALDLKDAKDILKHTSILWYTNIFLIPYLQTFDAEQRYRTTMSQKILITGVSGHLGSGVLDHLLKNHKAENLIAMARDPKKIERYAAKGVSIRQGDFNDPTSLDKAFADVHTLLVIPTVEIGPQRFAQAKNAVDAAKRAGVQHILYTGVIHHDEEGHGNIVKDHQDAEKYIAVSGIPHTFIRNGLYLDVVPMLLGNATESGSFFYPAAPNGVSFALRADLAEAAANIITTPGLHGKAHSLGLPQALTYPAIAKAVSDIIGKPVEYAPVALGDYKSGLLQHGLPEPLATLYTDMARAMGEGVIREPSNSLKDILGREPVGAETYLQTALQPAAA